MDWTLDWTTGLDYWTRGGSFLLAHARYVVHVLTIAEHAQSG